MAVTQNSFTGNGSTTTYSFTFPYLKQTEIKASLDGTATTAFTTPTATTVQFNTAPGSGVKIKIFRETDSDSLAATFYAGSAIKSEDLNDNFTQNLYATQEVAARYLSNLGGTMTGDLNLGEDVIIKFEGATDNDYETTLTVTDPTADRTITLPNVTGTVVTTGDTGTVATGMIADDAVTGAKIPDNAINSEHYTDGSIDTAHIADVNITTAKLADNAVTTAKITDANVTTAKIADANVTTAKIAADAVNGTKIADDSIDSEHIVDGSIDTAHIADSQITSAKIADATIVAADLASNAVTTAKITDANVTTAKIADSNVTTSKLADNAVTTAKVTDANITTAKLADNAVTTAKITDANVTTAKIADANVTTAKIADDNVTTAKIPDNAITTAKIADAELTTLAGMQTGTASILADSTALTATTTELNILDNKSFRASGDGALTTTSDTEIPSSKVIASHVAAQIGNVGGFTTIATDAAFPATASQPANGVIISISDAAGVVVNGSGVSTTGRTTDGTPATVTINSFPSSLNGETLASGVGLLVTSTGSGNTYTYHKLLAAESDVKQLSDDINDFNARYRVAGSAPGSNNDAGDMYFDTGSNKMKVYNGTTSTWDDVASVGNFYINTISSSSGTGGGSATFNGTAYRFTLSNAPTMAQQLIVSVNGVIQKPDAGSSQPSEGFAISGNDIIFSAAPASGSDYFIITQGSSVSIGTPSDNTVSTAKIQNLGVTNAKIANDTIAEGKLDVHNAPATGKYLKYTSNGMEWADGASEGTDVKSTGESGTTKFLRTDGDGTSSWQAVPSDSNKADIAGTEFTGNVGLKGSDQLKFYDSGDISNFVHLKAPSLTANTTYTLPDADGSSGEFLKTDGSGALDWQAVDLTNLNASNLTSGTVPTARLGSGANSSKFLRGDNSWQTISAAPEITGTASGSISNNAAVIAKTNGQIEAVTASTSIANPPTGAMLSADLDTTDNSYWTSGAYDSSTNCIVVLWGGWTSFNGFKVRTGVVSENSISWGTTQTINTESTAWREIHISASGSGKVAVFMQKNSGSQLYTQVGTIDSSNKSITFGSAINLSTNGYGGGSGTYLSQPTWMSSSTYACGWRKGGVEHGYVRTFSISGTTITLGSEHQIANNSHQLDGQVGLIYRNDKLVFIGRRKHPGNNLLLKCASISGTSMTWGSVRTDSVIAYKVGNKVGTFVADDKFVVAFYDSYNENNFSKVFQISTTTIDSGGSNSNFSSSSYSNWQLYWDSDISRIVMASRDTNTSVGGVQKDSVRIMLGSVSGTTLSWGTESDLIRNTTNNSEVRETYDFIYDSGLERGLIVANSNGGTNTTYDISIFSANPTTTTTNMTTDNFIGFSTAGYSNGQTATIAVVGNTTTKSSLTAGSKYYIKKDGSLSTTADTPSVEAGLALTSTKLLIK